MGYTIFILILMLNVLGVHGSDQCHATPLFVNPRAEARFSVVLSIRQSTGNQECAEISQGALQILSSIQWAINKINSANYVPGMSIGFDIYDDCGLDRYSAYNALDAISSYFPDSLRSCTGNTTKLYLGVLGTSRSQTTYTILNMLQGTNTPVISPFASLPNLRDFPNFLRTTPVDTKQVKVIVDLMEELGWTYVAAIHTDDNYGRDGIEGIQKLAKERGICIQTVIRLKITLGNDDSKTLENVITTLKEQMDRAKNNMLGVVYFGQKNIIEQVLIKANLNSKFDKSLNNIHWIMCDFVGTSRDVFRETSGFAHGTLTISTSAILFNEARDYFLNKWKTLNDNANQDPVKALMKEYKGQPEYASVTTESWRNDFTAETMNAVYVFVTALKDTFRVKCQQYTSICEGFESFLKANYLNYLKNVKLNYSEIPEEVGPIELISMGKLVQFDEGGDLIDDGSIPLYNINKYNHNSTTNTGRFNIIGNFTNEQLHLNKFLITQPYFQSACASNCPNCSETPVIPYEYLPGEVLFLGIFSLHDPVQNAFECGEIRTYTYDVIAYQAFLYAVEKARQTTGIPFGAIVFDDCYSATKISLIVTQFMSRMTPFKNNTSGDEIDPEKVLAIIGPSPSGVTIPVNFISTNLRIPSISYASSSPDLDDRINFPYFSRTVPSDVQQAQAMIEIIKVMGWKYVGLIYVKNNYGAMGKEMFLQKAQLSGICVEEPVGLSETSEDSELFQVSVDITEKPFEVVVYFGTHARIGDLLKVMHDRVKKGTLYNFIFLSSEDWGDSTEILSKAGSVARGSISFKIDTDVFKTVDQDFRTYIKSLSPDVRPFNSWFREFWRDYFQCDPDGRFDRSKGTPCPKNQYFSDANLTKFLNDQRVTQALNSVYATALGLKHVKDYLCKFGSDFPCKEMKTDLEYVVKSIRNVSLPSAYNTQTRVFDDNGNGNIGFKILNVQENSGVLSYEKVGDYKAGKLVLNKNRLRFYDSDGKLKTIKADCVGPCTKCRQQNITTQSPLTTSTEILHEEDVLRLGDIIIIAILGGLCLILFIAIIVIVCYFKRKMADLGRDIVYNRPNMVPVSYYNDDKRPAIEKFKQPKFNLSEIRFINQQDSNGGMTDLGSTMNLDNAFRNARPLQNYQELTNEHTSPKEGVEGVDNLAFVQESYLHMVNDEQMVSNNDAMQQNQTRYTHVNYGLTTNQRSVPDSLSPRVNETRNPFTGGGMSSPEKPSPSRTEFQLSHFRPELPPRDHPPLPSPHTNNTNNSSLDSTGHITPNGYPRMGTSPQLTNGYIPPISGHQSPIGLPRMGTGVQTPTPTGLPPSQKNSPVIEDNTKVLGTFSSPPKTPQQKVKRLPSQKDRKIMLQNAQSMERISRV